MATVLKKFNDFRTKNPSILLEVFSGDLVKSLIERNKLKYNADISSYLMLADLLTELNEISLSTDQILNIINDDDKFLEIILKILNIKTIDNDNEAFFQCSIKFLKSIKKRPTKFLD